MRVRIFMVALLAVAGVGGLFLSKAVMQSAKSSAAGSAFDDAARLTGFGIDMVVLTGHRFTADGDVFDALDLANARSLVSFDTEGVRRRLERLPWVQSAELTRVFPDRLDVRVRERQAFAVWTRNGRSEVIDETGRVLSAIHRSDTLALPHISGEGAAAEAQAILTLLARFPDVLARLETVERVGRRRWTLHLSRGVTVHLPADREAAVLQALATGGRHANLIDEDNRIIDLRATGRATVRQSVPQRSSQVPAFLPAAAAMPEPGILPPQVVQNPGNG